jgi:predicted metal-dependent peptidase
MAGKLPSDVATLIQSVLAPKATPESLIQGFLMDQRSDESTWSRRNKRVSHMMLPGPARDEMGCLVVAIDVSASISIAALRTFGGMLQLLIDTVQAEEIHVITCNTKITGCRTYQRNEEINLDFYGSGGTAFSPVFEHIAQAGWQPAGLIYLTDLDSHDTPPDPGYPVCWATYDSRRRAPFGLEVKID